MGKRISLDNGHATRRLHVSRPFGYTLYFLRFRRTRFCVRAVMAMLGDGKGNRHRGRNQSEEEPRRGELSRESARLLRHLPFHMRFGARALQGRKASKPNPDCARAPMSTVAYMLYRPCPRRSTEVESDPVPERSPTRLCSLANGRGWRGWRNAPCFLR